MLYLWAVIAGQIVDHLVCAKGVAGKDDMLISFFFCKGEVCFDILICIGEALIPRTDGFGFSGVYIDCFNLSEGIIGLGVYEINK